MPPSSPLSLLTLFALIAVTLAEGKVDDVQMDEVTEESSIRQLEAKKVPGLAYCGRRAGSVCCEGHICPQPYLTCDGKTEKCTKCGFADGVPCCDGMKCGSGLVCNAFKMCKSCGAEGKPCCDGVGPACKSGSVCGPYGTCVPCGNKAEPCCDGMKCQALSSPYEWRRDLQEVEAADETFKAVKFFKPQELTCDWQGKCVECGGEGEPCCEGMKCNKVPGDAYAHSGSVGLVCNVFKECVSCGNEFEPCCPSGPNDGCHDSGTMCDFDGMCRDADT